MIEKACRQCGAVFRSHESAHRRYCCYECSRLASIGRQTAPRVELSCEECGASFQVPARRVETARYCSYRCHQIAMGRRGGKVRGEQVKAHSEGRTYTKTNGRHTHRVVMENKLGRALRPGEIVHHKDGNKLNNAPGNLELISSQEEHARAHFPQMLAARKAKHGH